MYDRPKKEKKKLKYKFLKNNTHTELFKIEARICFC